MGKAIDMMTTGSVDAADWPISTALMKDRMIPHKPVIALVEGDCNPSTDHCSVNSSNTADNEWFLLVYFWAFISCLIYLWHVIGGLSGSLWKTWIGQLAEYNGQSLSVVTRCTNTALSYCTQTLNLTYVEAARNWSALHSNETHITNIKKMVSATRRSIGMNATARHHLGPWKPEKAGINMARQCVAPFVDIDLKIHFMA